MSREDPVIEEFEQAVRESPDVLPLRLRLIRLLLDRGRQADALDHAAEALRLAPEDEAVKALVAEAAATLGSPASGGPAGSEDGNVPEFDWEKAEVELRGVVVPASLTGGERDSAPSTLTLADVAGMDEAKRQIDMMFLGPLRNPELARKFDVVPRGGVILYGPPGCGKTRIAAALAGELGAAFRSVQITDILDAYVGASEQNLHRVFVEARANRPCLLHFDELDALGQKRSRLGSSPAMRQVVNQLLLEMDSATESNDGVFVLAATNHPWDVDSALRRPGRFDRMLFVPPPDAQARAAILTANLADKPTSFIDNDELAARTEGYSGADLVYLCRVAAQVAMEDSLTDGEARGITMDDFGTALAMVRPSTGTWFAAARNVVEFANRDGSFDDLADYLRKHKRQR